mmetsp:Transcript_2432/g.5437  ORF Transcript_2432/g.5437 Transcript_2432/m.5437 type:complete len:194 (-) Transcript_2432:149-730(-)|eukprot:CAMPEP_0204260210 /NCGR_PEP_ID=MMETSP0468-20130131/6170_1 /ASSEMBLY_ACC=CAM_ASM_000383 /TAXON_ID=2969 /ORGANISM="Oxyrrhis marina" /LENGTH=193 /DNA_ID=CAMNT_0051234603 /DNA_START=16 /DNA_END=597 /DNA_ORIENTATION=+
MPGKKRKHVRVHREDAPDLAETDLHAVASAGGAVRLSFDGAQLTIDQLDAATTRIINATGSMRSQHLKSCAHRFKEGTGAYKRASKLVKEKRGDTMPAPTMEALHGYEQALREELRRLSTMQRGQTQGRMIEGLNEKAIRMRKLLDAKKKLQSSNKKKGTGKKGGVKKREVAKEKLSTKSKKVDEKIKNLMED